MHRTHVHRLAPSLITLVVLVALVSPAGASHTEEGTPETRCNGIVDAEAAVNAARAACA